jgi:DNA modification methylase
MKLSAIRPNPTNPRLIKEERFKALVRSLEHLPDFSAVNALKLDENNQIVGGNMRYKAMKHLGWKWATVQVYDREYHAQTISFLELGKSYEDVIREMIIKDNRSFGEDDFDILANEWDAEELNEWGLDVWTGEPEETEGLTDPDDVPEVPEEPKTKLGDLYILGEHRLLCGDSTKAEDVEKLMNGEKADMVFTDPPYGVSYTGGLKDGKNGLESNNRQMIKNDDIDLYYEAVQIANRFSEGVVFMFYADTIPFGLYRGIENVQGEIVALLIWKKKGGYGALGASYKPNHEPCVIWKPKGKKTNFIGSTTENRIWEIDKEGINKLHPTQKPVELVERAITNHEGNIVLDLFLGSGTTVIAAEKTNRKCYGMELDPKYCDVIVKRWEDFTGKKAELWKQ